MDAVRTTKIRDGAAYMGSADALLSGSISAFAENGFVR
jgi:hypothetical protein